MTQRNPVEPSIPILTGVIHAATSAGGRAPELIDCTLREHFDTPASFENDREQGL